MILSPTMKMWGSCVLNMISGALCSLLTLCGLSVGGEVGADAPAELLLLKTCVEKSEGSVAVSPWSLYESLSLILPGAAGETEKQVRAVMPTGWGQKKEWHFLSKENKAVTVSVFSGLFADDSVTLTAEYRATVGDANILTVPLRSDRQKAVAIINSKTAKATDNRLKKLFSAADIGGESVLALGNAFYLQGIWTCRFERELTKPRGFTKEDGVVELVPMMENKDVFTESSQIALQGGNYYEKDGLQAASLMMRGDLLFMAALPPKGVKIKDFVRRLSPATWRELLTELGKSRALPPDTPVDHKHASYALRLPRFKVTPGAASLEQALIAMGMTNAFRSEANFSRLGACGVMPLKLNAVRQQCAIKVQEHGLEALVKTNADMEPFGGPLTEKKQPAIEFNRPFLWIVYSPRDEAILLMGTYMGPSK